MRSVPLDLVVVLTAVLLFCAIVGAVIWIVMVQLTPGTSADPCQAVEHRCSQFQRIH